MAIANITNNILTDSGVATSSLLPLAGGTLTGALSGTSATFSGANYIFALNGGGTSRIAGSISNTSGGMDFGLEGAGGNQLFTGVGPYEGGIGTSVSRAFHIVTNGTSRLSIASTGAATFSSSVTANGSLNGFQSGTQNLLIDWSSSSQITTLTNTELFFGTNAQRRLTITSGGNVLIGTTSDIAGIRLQVNGAIFNSGTAGLAIGGIGGRRRIQHDDGLSEMSVLGSNDGYYPIAASAFNTRSDYRLKEDLKDINGLEKVSKIRVYDFKWKDSDNRMDGVLAHELAEILPYAVNGKKDAVREDESIMPQGVDYSKIVPILVKAIQELSSEVTELKALIAAK